VTRATPPWDRLKDLAAKRRDAEAQRLSAAVRTRDDAEKRLAMLVSYRADYHDRLSTASRGGIDLEALRNYQAFLAQNGVTLELVPSHGAVENLARLKEGKADAAFVQGGLAASDADTDTDPAIVSLGALYYEPVWVFTRAPSPPARQLHDLIGHRIAVGEEGSGTRALAVQLLRSVGVGPKDATLSPKGNNEASAALLRGDVDAAIFVSGISAPVIRELIRGQDVRLVSIVHSTALARQHEYLSPITVARGLADVQADLPDHDITTVAVTANLLVRSDLHPALMYLLLDAASEINGRLNTRSGDAPLGTESVSQFRFGAQVKASGLRFDTAAIIGIGKFSPRSGFTFGVTYESPAFFPIAK